MSRKYKIQKNPFVVPTTDGKLIKEHWGNSTGIQKFLLHT